MATGEYKLIKDNGTTLDEKTILAEVGSALAFDSGKNPVMRSLVRIIEIKVIADNTSLTTGDGKATFTAPAELVGFRLVRAEMAVKSPSYGGNVTAMIRNLSTSNDMLSTAITVDEGMLNSYGSSTPSVVNFDNSFLSLGNTIAIDIDAAGSSTKGCDIILSFN